MVTVDLHADTSRVVSAFEELQRYSSLEGFQEAFELTFGTADLASKLICAEQRPAAEGTLMIAFEPTDRLLDFLAAARAGNRQGKISE